MLMLPASRKKGITDDDVYALLQRAAIGAIIGARLLLRRKPRYDGFLITAFGLWYGMQRVIEDFLREDVKREILGVRLTGSQMTAIVTMAVCLWHLVLVRRTPRWGRWDERPGGP